MHLNIMLYFPSTRNIMTIIKTTDHRIGIYITLFVDSVCGELIVYVALCGSSCFEQYKNNNLKYNWISWSPLCVFH